jgi:hypothetical protein
LGHAPVTGGVSGGARIRGVVASIRWAYYTAAKIEGYTVTRSKTGQWSVHARVVLADAFKVKQSPLFFVAMHEKGEWRWPIDTDTMELGSNTLRANLGPPLD